MKIVIVAALALSSLASFAGTTYSNVSDCVASTREVPGRNVNFGLPASQETIYCVSYKQVTVKRHILTDGDSRGQAVPGSKPWTTRSESNNRSCYRDGIFSSALTQCEAARADMLN